MPTDHLSRVELIQGGALDLTLDASVTVEFTPMPGWSVIARPQADGSIRYTSELA